MSVLVYYGKLHIRFQAPNSLFLSTIAWIVETWSHQQTNHKYNSICLRYIAHKRQQCIFLNKKEYIWWRNWQKMMSNMKIWICYSMNTDYAHYYLFETTVVKGFPVNSNAEMNHNAGPGARYLGNVFLTRIWMRLKIKSDGYQICSIQIMVLAFGTSGKPNKMNVFLSIKIAMYKHDTLIWKIYF